MARHLLFYDGECGLCDRAVQFVLERDRSASFLFAPLQGETADRELATLPDQLRQVDSLILIENYHSPQQRIYTLARGAFRVAWHLPPPWKLLGILSYLPSFLFDWCYRIVARNRRWLSGQSCVVPGAGDKERFLP